jgi:hypothetical protein
MSKCGDVRNESIDNDILAVDSGARRRGRMPRGIRELEAAKFPRESTVQNGARDEPKRHGMQTSRRKAELDGAELAGFDERGRAPSEPYTVSNRREKGEDKSENFVTLR